MTALRKTLRGVSLCVYAAAQAALALGLAAAMLLRVLAQRFPYASLHYLFAHRASLALFSRRELLAAAGMAAGVLAVIALLSRFALRTQLCFTVGTRRVRFGLLSAKTMWAAALLAAALVWGFVWVTCPLRVQPYWYEQYGLIAHAGGGITVDGRQYSYTNSREAVEQSYAAGHRVIELDFALTSDEYLVCTHDWADFHADPADRDVPVTKAEFMKSKPIGGGYFITS